MSNKILPNDPCWCGSGKKYKKCHRRFDIETEAYRKQGYTIFPPKLLKSAQDIEGIRAAGVITRGILNMLETEVKEGISTEKIDNLVREYTFDHGAIPAPLNYKGFPKSCCTSINECVCHGIPDENRILQNGDIVNIDITSILNGFYADSSRMYSIGDISENAQKIITVAKECLDIGIEQIKPYTRLNNIGDAIEPHAQKHGYSIVRDLCGHGVGKEFHEEPEVVHYAQARRKGVLMVPGMVFTIEPMVNEGSYSCDFLNDGWTVLTADRKLSAQWEHTLVVTETGYEILT
ncbi:MAG: type I methionyl aminopeptidase [Bacteroidales bacterium]|jgi:methionyl aminopeptidase|nr:type I methionyl aminopeptidase [Bacteroidales bacterium]